HSRWRRSRWPVAVAGVTFALLAAGHLAALPWYAEHRCPSGRPAAVIAAHAGPDTPVVCYPRNCDSVAFYLGRDDLRSFRSKQTHLLLQYLQERPRVVILCTHRHSLHGLREALPRGLRIVKEVHFGVEGMGGLPDGLAQEVAGLMGGTAL